MAVRNGQIILICLMSVNLIISLISLMTGRTSENPQCACAGTSQTQPEREYYIPDSTSRWSSSDNKISEFPTPSSFIPSQNGTSAARGSPRIFCWVMTMPANMATKAWAVYNTWAKRCDRFIFVSSKPSRHTVLPLLILNVKEDRNHLTAKTMQAFHHIYQHHINEADWFLKADDDTYVIVENLRHFLSAKDSNQAVHFGGKISNVPWAGHVRHGYNAGGPGYVLSKEAVRRFALEGIKNPDICPLDGRIEDVDIGFCLDKLGVKIGHTDDSFDRLRFYNFDPAKQMSKMHQYSARTSREMEYPFSDSAISFHYLEPASMYMYDYLLYKFKISNSTHKAASRTMKRIKNN